MTALKSTPCKIEGKTMFENLKKIKLVVLFVYLCVCVSCKTASSAAASAGSNTGTSVSAASGKTGLTASKTNAPQRAGRKKAAKTDSAQAFTPESFTEELQRILADGDVETALAVFEEVPEKYRDDRGLNYLHASLLLSAGKVQTAAEKIEVLKKDYPDDEDIQLLSAMAARASGDNKKSMDIIRSVLKKNPKNPDANAAMADNFMLTRNFKQANAYFGKGLESDPKHSASLFGFAQTSWYLDQIDMAKKAFIKLTDLEPENDMAWSYLAKLAAERRDYKLALEYIQKALANDAGSYYHWLDAGSYYLGVGDLQKAEEAWTRAITINPDYFLAYSYRGGLLDDRGKYKEALEDYRNVIRCNPKYYYAYESSAMLAWRAGNWQEALDGFLKASEMNPSSVSYKLMISACYHKMNKQAENKEVLAKAMKNMDRQSLDFLMLRLYYDGLGDSVVLNKVINEKSRTAKGKMLYYMALFYELSGKPQLANRIYLEVADMDAPLFFEYRLTKWAVEKMSAKDKKTAQAADRTELKGKSEEN